jgi:hypothetical protein
VIVDKSSDGRRLSFLMSMIHSISGAERKKKAAVTAAAINLFQPDRSSCRTKIQHFLLAPFFGINTEKTQQKNHPKMNGRFFSGWAQQFFFTAMVLGNPKCRLSKRFFESFQCAYHVLF